MTTPGFEFGCLPTAIGGMPQADASEACRMVCAHLSAIPAWPQLPRRAFVENMYAQFSQGFPGAKIEEGRLYVDPEASDFLPALERLHDASARGDFRSYAVTPDYAAGLHAFLAGPDKLPAVKGQVTGPVSWGLAVMQKEGLPAIYDETLAEAVVKHLRLKAAWEEKALRQISSRSIIFVDEPYLAILGSFSVSLSSEQVLRSIEEVLKGISGLKGLHCCGRADWSLLLKLPFHILSFDAYSYADSLILYPDEVKGLLQRGGAIAWGIVPNNEEDLLKETVASLADRLEEAMAPFIRQGIQFRQLIAQGLLTPSCSLHSLSLEAAEQALVLLTGLSARIRQRHIK